MNGGAQNAQAHPRTFWIVWGMNPVGIPVVCHSDKASAENAANALALRNPGQSFVVLESRSLHVVPQGLTRLTFRRNAG